jgi:hypothetical protein
MHKLPSTSSKYAFLSRQQSPTTTVHYRCCMFCRLTLWCFIHMYVDMFQLMCAAVVLLCTGQALYPWSRKFESSFMPACADWIQVNETATTSLLVPEDQHFHVQFPCVTVLRGGNTSRQACSTGKPAGCWGNVCSCLFISSIMQHMSACLAADNCMHGTHVCRGLEVCTPAGGNVLPCAHFCWPAEFWGDCFPKPSTPES